MAKGKCKFAGCKFEGFGRQLAAHYDDNPTHRPKDKPKRAKRGKAAAEPQERKPKRELSATAHIEAAIKKITAELNAKRETLANVEKLKGEITELDNQRQALQKLLPKV